MSSLAPVTGRLAQLFSPRLVIYTSTLIFSVGHLVSSQASELLTFLAGRTITGIGAAGILSVSIIVALEMSGEKRRGFFFGLVNAVFTLGLSLGAVVAGGLTPHIGWVSSSESDNCYNSLTHDSELCSGCKYQRA